VHLGLIHPSQYESYLSSCLFSPSTVSTVPSGPFSLVDPAVAHAAVAIHKGMAEEGRRLKGILDACKQVRLIGANECVLTYSSGMEPAKLNIGEYASEMNVGGTFPVGEVFTEPSDLQQVNGSVLVWAFPNLDRIVERIPVPFELKIEHGRIVHISASAPQSFTAVMDLIQAGEGELMIRELGLGLNKAMGRDDTKHVNDLTAFERQYGTWRRTLISPMIPLIIMFSLHLIIFPSPLAFAK
jgi:hypothetical protein